MLNDKILIMLPYIITYICLTTDAIYNQACNSALNATAITIHLTQDLDILQRDIETEVEKRTNKNLWGVGVMAYQMYSKEALIFSAPIKPIADTLSTNINAQSQNLTLTWTF